MISLILGNPRSEIEEEKIAKGAVDVDEATDALDCPIITSSRATLIVVPTTLLGQWWRELHKLIIPEDLEIDKFEVVNVTNQRLETIVIKISDIISTASSTPSVQDSPCLFIHNEIQVRHKMDIVFTVPWGSPGKVRTTSHYICCECLTSISLSSMTMSSHSISNLFFFLCP